MTQQQGVSISELEPFKRLSAQALKRLTGTDSLMRFGIGQPLTVRQLQPSQVLLILQGQARLLAEEHGRPVTLVKLKPGSFVGLASMLRAGPCEQVTASRDLLALAIPEDEVLTLFREEQAFREWCNTTLFPAEVQSLVEELIRRSPRSDLSVRHAFEAILPNAELVVSDGEGVAATTPGRTLVVACHNLPSAVVGDQLPIGATLPPCRPPLTARLISIPDEALKQFETAPSNRSESSIDPESTLPAHTGPVSNAPLVLKAGQADLGQYAPKNKTELVRAEGPLQEALACFQMLATELDLPFRKDSIEKILRDALRRGQKPNLQLYGGLATMLGLHVTGSNVPTTMAGRLQTPAMIPWKDGFALLKRSNAAGLLLASPKEGWVQLSLDEVEAAFPEGIDLLIMDRSAATPEQRFGVNWFWPAIRRYRGVLSQVLVASFVVQLFGLANPLLIQVIIDKVITQRSLDTLQVLGIALVVVTILEGVLGSLRTFLFAETTNRIDTRLGAEVIDHLLRLPLGYFDKRPVGELSSRIGELEKIRSFLTGQALTTVLDAAFSVIYIIVMVLYSWLLTLVALAVVPIQVALTLIGAPLFRRQTRETAENNSRSQSHLVEVLSGIQTVKAQNVEMVSRWKWQELYAKYISSTFEKTLTGTALNQVTAVLQKLSQLMVLWVGATLVLDGQLTLGQLIAFRIISGYVTQPILRLSSIWQSIQELRVSFERLADVVDTPEESSEKDKANIPLPGVHGRVIFDGVGFSFVAEGPEILKNVNLEIEPGKFVGVVGQSGSGKSTLMKLLPRLYKPQKGRILIDDYDISKVELYSLRRQVGIVPQDPLLFSGSVSSNIALTNPEADSDEIVRVSKIACAHEFVMGLANGYSSDVGERGSNLSGGQRQRLAIARTLLSKPRLLVMDEATSALDYDTERRVCDNLRENMKNCTVLFITHRLNTIRNADLIVMMHQGAVVEQGSHDELIALQGRYYALYLQQESN
jgi:ATP-binding cassette subfamily B protein